MTRRNFSIWKAYKYLFYLNIRWNQNLGWCRGTQARDCAFIGMSLLFFLYFISIGMFMIFIGCNYLYVLTDLPIYWYGMTALIVILHYFLFLYQNRSKQIIAEFQAKESTDNNTKIMIIFGSYFIGAILSLVITGALMYYSGYTGFTIIGYFKGLHFIREINILH